MRLMTVTIAITSTLFACQALANASEGIVNAPAPSAMIKGGRANARASRPSSQRATVVTAAQSQDAATPSQPQPQPSPAQQDPGPVCCCRFFAQGWQHAWRGQSACEGAGGSCVAPDHCRQ